MPKIQSDAASKRKTKTSEPANKTEPEADTAPEESVLETVAEALADPAIATIDRRHEVEPVQAERRVLQPRAKVTRRRQIDPTTCERDYSVDEVEFMNALDDYKRASGRMFPTCSEVLEVLRDLGYRKCPPELVEDPTTTEETSTASPTEEESEWSEIHQLVGDASK